MLNKLQITDLSKAKSYAFGSQADYNAWISTVDEEDEFAIKRMKRLFEKKGIIHLAQYFYDWSDEDPEPYIQKNLESQGPQKTHVQTIITFLKQIIESPKVYNLGINCFAGVSRSTAIGIIALVLSGKTPKMALDYILTIRPQSWPNLRILRFASEILGQDLLGPVKDWKQQNRTIFYLNELE